MSILKYGKPGPPDFVADEGALCYDLEGLLWIQLGAVRGAYWDIFTPHGAYTDIVWSSENLQLNRTIHSPNVSLNFVAPATNTADYFTMFNNRHTMRVMGLVLPLCEHNSGAISVKAAIYGTQLDFNFPHAPGSVVPGMQFELLNFTPTLLEPLFVPYATPGQDPLILRKGKYYIRHVWGQSASVSFVSRLPYDYNSPNGTTTSNRFRADRRRESGVNFHSETLFNESFKATQVGSLAGAGNMAVIDFGIYGEILD
jgi:hypothetical protein